MLNLLILYISFRLQPVFQSTLVLRTSRRSDLVNYIKNREVEIYRAADSRVSMVVLTTEKQLLASDHFSWFAVFGLGKYRKFG